MVKRAALLLLLASVASGPSCADRLRGEEQEDSFTWCSPVVGVVGYDEDGEHRLQVDPETELTVFVCTCSTLDERVHDEALQADVNDMAHDACVKLASAWGYADANNCRELHDSGIWIEYLGDYNEGEAPMCEENGEPRGGCGG